MCLCPSYIPGHTAQEPSMYRAECTLHAIPDFADGYVDTLLPFGELMPSGRFVYDTTFELYTLEHFTVFCRVVALVRKNRNTLG